MKILLLRFSSIGDIVLTTPVIRAVKQQVPDAEVHFATKTAFRDVLAPNPYIDKLHLLGKEKAMPITLSGCEQQRLAIARAVVSRPSILIADEPTGNLDEGYANEIMALFYAFQQVGVTVVIATHDLHKIGPDAAVLQLGNGTLESWHPGVQQPNDGVVQP